MNLRADTWLKGVDMELGRVCLSLGSASVLQLSRCLISSSPLPHCVCLCLFRLRVKLWYCPQEVVRITILRQALSLGPEEHWFSLAG